MYDKVGAIGIVVDRRVGGGRVGVERGEAKDIQPRGIG